MVPAQAQMIPGASDTDWNRERQLFTAEVLREFNAAMAEWRGAWQRGDARTVASFYSEGAYLVGVDGKLLRGRQAIEESLKAKLPKASEIRTGLSDFIASDRLAYAIGPFWYQYQSPDQATETVTGTYVTVLVPERNSWKIRSQTFQREPSAEPTQP